MREWQRTSDYQVSSPEVDKVPPFDSRSGEHLWIMALAYRVVPELWADPTHTPTLDMENLLSINGPGCYYCEQVWTPLLASRRCKGAP